MSYPPPVPRTTFQGHRVQGNSKVDDVHANIFQGHRVSGHRDTGFRGTFRKDTGSEKYFCDPWTAVSGRLAESEGTSMVLRVRSVGSVGRLGRGFLELCLSGGKRVGACVMPWLAVLWPLQR